MACGSRDIRDIVSACTVWFTFVFRTPTPRAVEDFVVEVLHDSRGSTLALRLPRIPHLYPYCITTRAVCQEVFYIFLRGAFIFIFTAKASHCRLLSASLLSPLDTLIVSQLGRFVKGFFTFFFDDWNLHRPFLRVVSCVRLKSLPVRERCSLSLLDIISIPQTAPKVNW